MTFHFPTCQKRIKYALTFLFPNKLALFVAEPIQQNLAGKIENLRGW